MIRRRRRRRRRRRPAGCGKGAVIGFITTSALPGCADRSVSSSEYRRHEYDEKFSQESFKYTKTNGEQKNEQKKTPKRPTIA